MDAQTLREAYARIRKDAMDISGISKREFDSIVIESLKAKGFECTPENLHIEAIVTFKDIRHDLAREEELQDEIDLDNRNDRWEAMMENKLDEKIEGDF
jgi:hypothetical protein